MCFAGKSNKCWCWWRPFLCQLGNQIHTFIANIGANLMVCFLCVCFRNFHSLKLFESNNYTKAEIKITLLMVVFIAFCLLSVVHSISLGGARFLFAACFMSFLSFHSAHCSLLCLNFCLNKKKQKPFWSFYLCCAAVARLAPSFSIEIARPNYFSHVIMARTLNTPVSRCHARFLWDEAKKRSSSLTSFRAF